MNAILMKASEECKATSSHFRHMVKRMDASSSPDGYPVPPPELPADAPVPDVFQPHVVCPHKALRQDFDAAICNSLHSNLLMSWLDTIPWLQGVLHNSTRDVKVQSCHRCTVDTWCDML